MSASGDEPQASSPAAQEQELQVPVEAKDLVVATVVGAKDAVCSTVAGAKAAVSSVVDVAKGAVQEGVEKTRSAVTSSMDTVMGSSLGQKVVSGLDVVLEKSEQWVDHYLPMTDEELAALATPVEGAEVAPVEKQRQSYYVRLGSLSTSLQQRAYQHSLGKMRHARQSTLEALAQLQQAVDLINYAKQIVDEKLQDGQDKLYQMWLACTKEQSKGQEDTDSAEIEVQALAMSDHLLQQLKSNCSMLLGSIKGLPSSLQNKAQQIYSSMEELQAFFSPAKYGWCLVPIS
ncbi:perilipin-3-like [Alligator sinensis]|uniref:Perilipin-3-like n=1 Tax=Alligator sinensis TaxID=38654 RepID=A0A1U8DYC0_ALLSI|nr:perilipin-3-like [Alligator sinensis]